MYNIIYLYIVLEKEASNFLAEIFERVDSGIL
jgi:hypothetical protein